MNPIQTETKGIRPISYNGGNELAYYTYLKDVRYQVRAHFEQNRNHPELYKDWNENKHHNIAKRMVQRGGRRDIFLGTRECQAFVEPCEFGQGESAYDSMPGEVDYGFMYHGITYADEAILEEDKNKMTVRFWRPVMQKAESLNLFDRKNVHKNDISEIWNGKFLERTKTLSVWRNLQMRRWVNELCK